MKVNSCYGPRNPQKSLIGSLVYLGMAISLHSPWPAAAYSSTAHPTPPDRPPYCSLRTGGREGRSGG